MTGKPTASRHRLRLAALALIPALGLWSAPGAALATDLRFDAVPDGGTRASQITLTATVSFERGDFYAHLNWSGQSDQAVDVHRDGETVATVPAGTATHVDLLGKPRNGSSFAYQVCQAATCSPLVSVVTERRGRPSDPPGKPDPSVRITTSSLPTLNVLETYQATLAAEGGATPYTWSATDLPAGLTIDSATGIITNDPTAPAITGIPAETVTVTVTDSGGTTDQVALPLELILIDRMAAGSRHVCALTTATTVYCWGSNSSGQLGDGTYQDRPLPAPVIAAAGTDGEALTGVVDISAGDTHTCAVLEDGTAYCWGFNGAGRLGLGHDNPVDLAVPHPVVGPGGTGRLSGVTAISAGSLHSCAVTGAGTAYCWGDNFRGQLGAPGQFGGTPTAVADPDDLSQPLTGLVAIGTGGFHSCAVTGGGTGYCWGWNHVGQLGLGATFPIQSSTARVVADPEDLTQPLTGLVHIDGGGVHTCAATGSGVGYCWGQNAHGQVGNGNAPANVLAPSLVADPDDPDGALTGLRWVGPGTIHSCAVTYADTAFCWGNNSEGQLGDGGTDSTDLPVAVADPGAPEQVFAGVSAMVHNGWQTCAVTVEGLAYCWGHNADGQLGDGTTVNRYLPTPVHPGG